MDDVGLQQWLGPMLPLPLQDASCRAPWRYLACVSTRFPSLDCYDYYDSDDMYAPISEGAQLQLRF